MTLISVSGTWPVLVTRIVQVSVEPGAAVSRSTVLVIAMPLGFTSAVSVSRGFGPDGGTPVTVAVLAMPPSPTVAVQV